MPSPDQLVADLRRQIAHHDHLYYQDAQPEISDAEYDALFRQLEQLEADHPHLRSHSSPTQRVGGQPLEGFSKVAHLAPMLSIDDVFELSPKQLEEAAAKSGATPPRELELISFYQRLQKNLGAAEIPVTIEPKIDGVAVSLVYREGKLARAVTRGDGATGDDVTQNIRTIRSIPLQLHPAPGTPTPPLLDLRGEVFMPDAAFARLNAGLDEAGRPAFANPRNATAGTLKLLDPKAVAARPLAFLAHSLGAYDGPELATEDDFFQLLDQLALPRNQPILHAHDLPTLLAAVTQIGDLRHSLGHQTDGAVIKLLDRHARATLGATSRAPRWAAAYKFLPEQQETTLTAISIQVGRTGVLTPVAELEPTLISGSTVARATLHNDEEIARKDIRIGDRVIIAKAGEIIPAVISVVKEKRPEGTAPFDLFSHVGGHCPSCHSPIIREQGFVAWRCPNFACPAQAVTRITHFASRKALDLAGLGDAVASKLVEAGLAHDPIDLFSLDPATLPDLLLDPAQLQAGGSSKPRRLGERRAMALLNSLDRARSAPLHRWVFAMGIPNVGQSAARELARLHQDLSTLASSPILGDIVQAEQLEAEARHHSPRNRSRPPADDADRAARQATTDQLKAEAATIRDRLAPLQITPDVGPVAAAATLLFFRSEAGQQALARLAALDINPTSDNYRPAPPDAAETADLPLSGLTFVITGTLSRPRPEFQALIEQHGGKVTSSITSATSYLLCGEGGGTKRTKAEKLGVPLLDEPALLALLP
jgi:DNA ligase (NAD+)